MKRIICRLKPYIQPFELQLALDELSALAQSTPTPIGDERQQGMLYEVITREPTNTFVDRLTYWETVVNGTGTAQYTRQILSESTMAIVRNGVTADQIASLVPFRGNPPIPNKRCLRYGTHGIHEYRGKFFPQLVRSLINVERVRTGGIVVDPMSGSGTTVVEAVQLGCRGVGLDMNPLSVLLGNTKAGLLQARPEDIAESHQNVRASLLQPRPLQEAERLRYFQALPQEDQAYLSNWLPEVSIIELDRISRAIETIEHAPSRNLMRMSLSNIIRRVSWQKDDDLRVRRDDTVDVDTLDPIGQFLREFDKSVKTVLASLHQNQGMMSGTYSIQHGDARQACSELPDYAGQVDIIITSPPYATALPYLDTDRLSLCWLGLLPRPEHRQRDQLMIGNREISDRIRLEYWQHFVEHRHELPESVGRLIENIGNLNSQVEVGFRRKNIPSLLSKYFFDMSKVLRSICDLLKPGASAYIIVGNNHTIAGGRRVDIPTADLLADIAVMIGMEQVSYMNMEMLSSRDIFKKNAMNSEVILHLRRPLTELQLPLFHLN